MNYDKLINRLNTKLQSYAAYTDSEFAHVMEDAITAIEALRADLARVTAERDAAISDLECETTGTPRACDCCKNREKSWCKKNLLYGCCKWEWRGLRKED